jgi:hypothetical protein
MCGSVTERIKANVPEIEKNQVTQLSDTKVIHVQPELAQRFSA